MRLTGLALVYFVVVRFIPFRERAPYKALGQPKPLSQPTGLSSSPLHPREVRCASTTDFPLRRVQFAVCPECQGEGGSDETGSSGDNGLLLHGTVAGLPWIMRATVAWSYGPPSPHSTRGHPCPSLLPLPRSAALLEMRDDESQGRHTHEQNGQHDGPNNPARVKDGAVDDGRGDH